MLFRQQATGVGDPVFIEKFDKSLVCEFFEKPAKCGRRHADLFCHFVQREGQVKILLHKVEHLLHSLLILRFYLQSEPADVEG